MHIFKRIEHYTKSYLSHHPKLYAMIVGIGIVLFWRGVWHSTDHFPFLLETIYSQSSTTLVNGVWWDGPFSFIVGCIILSFTGAFTSSFIGNELILSGLRGEKKLNQRTEIDLKNEVFAIADIKDELVMISNKLEILQKQIHKNHKNL